METYSKFAPTSLDSAGAFLPDRQEWLVAPVSRTRDSRCLDQSNFSVALETMGGESDDVEVHRFGHWGPGWFEIIIVRPGSPAEAIALDLEKSLEDYPVLDEEDFSRRESEEADRVWSVCYRPAERVKYIRDHRSEFQFCDLADMLGCVRGRYFAGYASELIG